MTLPAMNDPLATLALSRLAYGPRPGEVDEVSRQGFRAWLDHQLAPPPGDDPATAARLARTTLRIKYNGNDKWPAVDEMRPMALLGAPIDTAWALTVNDPPRDGTERRRPRDEVIAATLIRAIESPYQLREMMVQFWYDHFNVDAWGSETIAIALPSYDRDVIRPHCLGNFRAFLEAVASSTAMLYYLSNRSSRAGSANENFARELFELHTLGRDAYLNDKYDRWRSVPGAIDGKPSGYIDQDIYEAARALTGWTVEDGTGIDGQRKLPKTGRFAYIDTWHDGYQKRVLGTEFDAFAPAMADGRRVLDLVAAHPATARNLATKLCRRLVGAHASAKLIDAAAAEWHQQAHAPDQIARVVRLIATSPDFAASRGAKLRRPLALVASFARATGIALQPTDGLTNALANAGQRLYGFPTPNGPPDDRETYLGTNETRQRWALLLGLAENSYGTGPCEPSRVMGASAATVGTAIAYWLTVFDDQSGPPRAAEPALVAGLAQDLGWSAEQPVGPSGRPDTEKRLARIAAVAAMAPPFQNC